MCQSITREVLVVLEFRGPDKHLQFTDIHLDDCSFCEYAELGVHGVLRIFLDGEDRELNCDGELWVGNVCLFVSQAHGPDKAFIFDGAAGEVRSHCGSPER